MICKFEKKHLVGFTVLNKFIAIIENNMRYETALVVTKLPYIGTYHLFSLIQPSSNSLDNVTLGLGNISSVDYVKDNSKSFTITRQQVHINDIKRLKRIYINDKIVLYKYFVNLNGYLLETEWYVSNKLLCVTQASLGDVDNVVILGNYFSLKKYTNRIFELIGKQDYSHPFTPYDEIQFEDDIIEE